MEPDLLSLAGTNLTLALALCLVVLAGDRVRRRRRG